MDGRSAKPAGTAPIDRARYDRYAGQYLSEQHVVWTVRRRGERLVAQWIGKPVERVHAPSFEVFPQSESAFCNEFWGIQIMFIYPETGQTVKLAMTSSGREGSVEMARISTDFPEAPAPVHVDPRVYDGYVGRYRKAFLFGIICLGPTLNISHDTDELGDHLVAQVRGLPGYDRAEIFPISETCFIQNPTTSDDLQLTFVRNRKGKATHVMVYWNGSRIRGTRISNEPTK